MPFGDQYLRPNGCTELSPEKGPLLNLMTYSLLVVAPSGKMRIGALPLVSFSSYLASIIWPTLIFSSFVPALSKNTQSIATAILPMPG